MISRLGIEPPTIPVNLGISPLLYPSLGSSRTQNLVTVHQDQEQGTTCVLKFVIG